jgi:hypothetical protein
MLIETSSGSIYTAVPTNKGLKIKKVGSSVWDIAIAIYPDRLPFLEATVKIVEVDNFHEGFNAKGVKTLRFDPSQVRKGMILANRRGLRSTTIVSIK